MSNTYQKTSRCAQLEPLPGEIAVPEQVMVSMTEIAVCVPKTSSTSCDQAIFVDQATDASVSSDAVLVEVGRFG